MLHHMTTILVCYGGQKWPPKYKNPPIWANFWFPSRLWCCELISIIWEPYNIISCCVCSVSCYVPQTKFQETYCVCSVSYQVPKKGFGDLFFFLHRFLLLLSPQTKFGDFLFLHRLLLLLWTYVKIFDLTYIRNCQRDFHKTWHIY